MAAEEKRYTEWRSDPLAEHLRKMSGKEERWDHLLTAAEVRVVRAVSRLHCSIHENGKVHRYASCRRSTAILPTAPNLGLAGCGFFGS